MNAPASLMAEVQAHRSAEAARLALQAALKLGTPDQIDEAEVRFLLAAEDAQVALDAYRVAWRR